jgi:hypothetical protein
VKEESLIFSTGEWKWEYREVVIEGNEPVPPLPDESTPRDSSTNLYSLPEESSQEVRQETVQEDPPEHFTTDPHPDVDSITQGMRDTYLKTNRTSTQSYLSYNNENVHYEGFKESSNSVLPNRQHKAIAFSSTSTYNSSNEPKWNRNRIRTRDTGSGEKTDKSRMYSCSGLGPN